MSSALYIRELFPVDITSLVKQVLNTMYFHWNGSFYEQTDGVAMGSPLSLLVANFYTEKFEEMAMAYALLRPKCWL